jgi:hypothetical protein
LEDGDDVEPCKPAPTDAADGERAFVAPHLTLMTSNAPRRDDDLAQVFDAPRWVVRAGASRRCRRAIGGRGM